MRGFERCAFAVCIAFAAMPALADWKDDYARGLEAARAGRWNDVARYMNDALAGNAQPAARLRLYGQRYETYAPQHYAGLAALRMGDCAGAIRYWSQPANTAFVAGNASLLQEQQKGRDDCSNRLAAQKPPAPQPSPSTATTTPTPAVASRPAQVSPAPLPATPKQKPIAATPSEVPSQASTPRAPPPAPRVIQQSAPAAQPAPAASTAGLTLRPLLAAYLSGRYAEVVTLSSRSPDDPRLRWHTLTLRAAAAFNLAQLGEDAKAQAVADQAVADARRTDPSRKPDPTFYSPTFISYFAGRE